MNVIMIMGGLGNQLFQYAFGQVQMRNGIEVKYNTNWYTKVDPAFRPYRLDKFCINDIEVSPLIGQRTIRENKFNLNLLEKNNRNFLGYWQYYLYYESIFSVLKKEFQVKEKFYTEKFLELRKKIINGNSVSVHVRRDDYDVPGGFGCLPFQYYFNAIRKVKGDLFIFSDDMTWCKEHFKQDYFSRKITFVHSRDYLDFELMRLCKHHIIANSTFSWWPAYLNDDSEKIVVAPAKGLWYGGDSFLDMVEHRYPNNWIKM